MLRVLTALVLIITIFAMYPPPVLAQASTNAAQDICHFLKDTPYWQTCSSCAQQSGVWTALGCIHYEPQVLITSLLRFAIGIAGGIAFLMILYGGFIMMTSAGNPKQLANAQEIIMSAVGGILLIVFSVLIIKVVGVDILKLPGIQ